MSRFPTAGHLGSWAKFAPGVKESAGKKKGKGATGHGNRYLAKVLGEAAVTAGRTDTFLGERYRRIARRRGKKTAIVAVGRSMLVIIWHLLSDPEARFIDLGSDYHDKHIDTERKKRTHIRQLEALGIESPSTPQPDPRHQATAPSPQPGSADATPGTGARRPRLIFRISYSVFSPIDDVPPCSPTASAPPRGRSRHAITTSAPTIASTPEMIAA
jgi:hypothetical protein